METISQCPQCQTPRNDQAKVCPVCWFQFGQKVPDLTFDNVPFGGGEEEQADCRVCGVQNAMSAKACAACGAGEPGAPAKAVLRVQATSPATVVISEGEFAELGRGSGLPRDITRALNPYDFVSRHHLSLRMFRRQVEITDRSANGTWVNGERLDKGTPRLFSLPVDLSLAQECKLTIEAQQ